MQPIRLTTATDVLAAVPAILGFVPADSVVTVGLIDHDGQPATVGFVARTDATAAAPIDHFRHAIAQAAVTSAIWVVVGTGEVAAAGLDQVEELQRGLESQVRNIRTLVAQSLEFGAEWFDTNGHESGVTEDPNASDVSLAKALNGRPTASSRDEIAARFAEGPAVDTSTAYAAAADQGEEFVRTTITELAATLRNRQTPSPDLAARVGVCATVPLTRDALIGVVAINAAAAVDTFTAVAAQLRGNPRFQLLALAGLSAYVDGNGALAGIAFEVAQSIKAETTHTGLLDLLDKSLNMGVAPDVIAELVEIGSGIAESFGIDIDDTTH